MVMQEVKGASFNKKWNGQDIQVGDKIEGFYVENHKSNFADDDATYYVILKEDDTKMDIKGTAGIESKFKEIPVGSLVRVTYLGKEKTKRGMFFNNYKVEFDPDTKAE